MTLDDILLRKLSETPRVQSYVGIFLGMVNGLARLNLQGAAVDVKCDGWVPPIPGMAVRVESLNGVLRVKGPSTPRSALGEVVESLDGDTRARVVVDGEEWVLPVTAPYVPLPTDKVVIDWMAGFVSGEQAAARVDDTPPPAPPKGVGFAGLLVQATDSGRWSTSYGNWFGNSDVWTGTTTQGAWFYGGGFRVLAGANVSTVEIYLPLIQQQNNLQFGLHGHASKGGSPGITSTFTHTGPRSGWVRLPDGWGNALRDNPNWGVGVLSPGGGLNQWVGRASDAMSGALRFSGTR